MQFNDGLTVYSLPIGCPNCRKVKAALERDNIVAKHEDITTHPELLEHVKANGHTTAPVVVGQRNGVTLILSGAAFLNNSQQFELLQSLA